MTESSSQNIESVNAGDSSPTSADTEDIPRPVLEAAANVYGFLRDEHAYQCALEVTEHLDDALVNVAEACERWADDTGHEGLAREAFRADAYIEVLERVLTSVALDSRLQARRAR